jgi:hypothetical protein
VRRALGVEHRPTLPPPPFPPSFLPSPSPSSLSLSLSRAERGRKFFRRWDLFQEGVGRFIRRALGVGRWTLSTDHVRVRRALDVGRWRQPTLRPGRCRVSEGQVLP